MIPFPAEKPIHPAFAAILSLQAVHRSNISGGIGEHLE